MKKGPYIKALEKVYFKRLKHIKKPTRRKRRIVAEHAFAAAMFHLKNGVKTQ